ncbi:MAG: CAP family protein, partial [Hyphomicrobium sp.]
AAAEAAAQKAAAEKAAADKAAAEAAAQKAAAEKAAADKAAAEAAAQKAAADPLGLLAPHNDFRARHGAPPLTWSAVLAASAQTWANQCKLNHDPNNAGFGENIAWGTTSAAVTVAMWYNEVAKYDFTNPGFTSQTGHFTQVVWKGSTQLGCGMAMGCPGAFNGGYWVCRYAPPGNMQGAFEQNVAPAK